LDVAHSTRRAWPLALKLPLLMTGLLAVLLATTLALTYVTLTRSAMATAEERLQRAGDQLGSLLVGSVAQRRAQLTRAGRDGNLARALLRARASGADGEAVDDTSPEVTAARASLERLMTGVGDGLAAELWTDDGRRVASVGPDIPPGDLPRSPDAGSSDRPHPLVSLAPARGFDSLGGFDAIRQSDSLYLGELYVADGSAYFWAVVPIAARGERLGHLLRQFRIARGERVDETIRALTSADVSTYYRSLDGSPWVTISGDTASAPVRRDSADGRLVVSRPGVGDLLAMETPILGTQLVLVMERPVRSVLAAPRASVRQLAIVSLALLIVGGGASWLVSRRITRPLVALTGAAEALGRGDYGARVAATGDDELVRLADSFNRMVSEVGTAHAELEVQTEEAQATAEMLDRSNGELAAALADLEERETQFRVLADTIPHLSWMAHADGSIFWCNDRWHSYTGASPDEVADWGWRSVADRAMLQAAEERWQSCITAGTSFEMELPLRRADGHVRWFLTRARPVHDAEGRVVRWFGTDTDIQALREAREAAESARADAELARAQAESANRAKSEFLAVMSHELRTPLNAIGGYTELLELGLRGPVTDAQRHDLDRIRTNQQHLLGLIGGVLDLSRIEAGRVSYDLAAVPLDEFLAGLNGLVEPQAAAKSLTLAYVPCAPGLAVCADREKLRQILLNLLSNAIRYTPPGGRIAIAGEAIGNGQVAITVRDTGIGIAPEAMEQVFQPFVQLDRSLTRIREGVGLGLAISLDLARGMAGELSATSMAGEGSCFTLRLPEA
jgi:PAS domain S-box-containing protein